MDKQREPITAVCRYCRGRALVYPQAVINRNGYYCFECPYCGAFSFTLTYNNLKVLKIIAI